MTRCALLLLLPLFLTANPATAQGLKNHDSNAPVNFSADRIEVQDRSDRVVVSGNVIVDQGGLKLNAQRMTVNYRKTNVPQPAVAAADSGVQVQRIDASGDVLVRNADQTARGNVAIYDLNTRLITMLGNVRLDQGANHLSGGRLVMDLASGRSTVDGRASGGGTPGVSGGGGGRVSGTFTVPQRGNPSK